MSLSVVVGVGRVNLCCVEVLLTVLQCVLCLGGNKFGGVEFGCGCWWNMDAV